MRSLDPIIQKSRERLLRMHYESGVGHIGGNLSCLDAIVTLHHRVMRKDDLFVLSKGHSAGALYVALWSKGLLTDGELEQFHKGPTKLSGHPAPGWKKEIVFATGSLGHGFPLAAGLALGKKLKKEKGRVFCVMSDGEWEEGSNWEALIFAAHHRLTSLTLLVDLNGLQGFGTLKEVAGLQDLPDRLRSFKVKVEEVDGHDWRAMEKLLSKKVPGPRAVILRTKKGRGISFMENKMEWHYLPMNEAQYRQALKEIEKP